MQIGIAAYLRSVAVRFNRIGRTSGNSEVEASLAAISAELADKAEVLEANFRGIAPPGDEKFEHVADRGPKRRQPGGAED